MQDVCPPHGDTAGLGTPKPAQGDLQQPHCPGLSLSWSCIPGLPPGSRCGVSPTARPVQRGFVASRGFLIFVLRGAGLALLLLPLPHPRLQARRAVLSGSGVCFQTPHSPLCRAAWGEKWAFTAWAGAAGEGEVPKLTGNTWDFIKKQQQKNQPNKTNIFASTAKPTNNFQPQSIFPCWGAGEGVPGTPTMSHEMLPQGH